MGYYKLNEIAAIRDCERGVICLECATDEEMIDLTSGDIIDNKEAEDTYNSPRKLDRVIRYMVACQNPEGVQIMCNLQSQIFIT